MSTKFKKYPYLIIFCLSFIFINESCRKKEVRILSARISCDKENVFTEDIVTMNYVTDIVYDKKQLEPEKIVWSLRDNKDNAMQALSNEQNKITWSPKDPGTYKFEIVATYRDENIVRRDTEIVVYPSLNYFKNSLVGNFVGTASPQWNTYLFWTLTMSINSNNQYSASYTNDTLVHTIVGNGNCFYFATDTIFPEKKIVINSLNEIGIGSGTLALMDSVSGAIKQYPLKDMTLLNDGRNLSFTLYNVDDNSKKIKYVLSK